MFCSDFMNTAEMAGREFDAEKWNVKLLDAQTRQVLVVSEQTSVDLIDLNLMDVFRSTLTREEKRRLAQQLNR